MQGKSSPMRAAHLCGEAGASIHDESPQLLTAGHRGDVQPVHVALLHMLVHPRVGHVVVVPLLHGPVGVVHRDPLRGWQAQPDLLLRALCHRWASGWRISGEAGGGVQGTAGHARSGRQGFCRPGQAGPAEPMPEHMAAMLCQPAVHTARMAAGLALRGGSQLCTDRRRGVRCPGLPPRCPLARASARPWRRPPAGWASEPRGRTGTQRAARRLRTWGPRRT